MPDSKPQSTGANELALVRSQFILAESVGPQSIKEAIEQLRRIAAPLTPSAFVVQALNRGLVSGEITLTPNGHWRDGAQFEHAEHEGLRTFVTAASLLWELSDEQAAIIAVALASHRSTKEPVTLGRGFMMSKCHECGEEVAFETDGQEIRVKGACPYPRGVYPIQIDLDVPSGKLVFANDLRQWFDYPGRFDIMSEVGVLNTTKQYADEGLAFIRIPHPSQMTGAFAVNRLELGILHVEPLSMKFADMDPADLPRPMLEQGNSKITVERLGEIPVRPVWWSGADYDALRARFEGSAEQFAELLKEHCLVVEVEPGRYRINSYEQQDIPEDEYGIPFHSFLIRSGDCETTQQQRKRPDYTAGQMLYHTIRSYPDLYFPKAEPPSESEETTVDIARELNRVWANDNLAYVSPEEFASHWRSLSEKDQLRTIVKAVNSMFFGSSFEWDKSGWCTSDAGGGTNEGSIEIPVFPPGMEWEELSPGFSTLTRAAGMEMTHGDAPNQDFIEVKPAYLNPSFRKLAFNVLQSVIRTGAPKQKWDENDYCKRKREESPHIAQLVLERLAKRYPEDVPEYCADLLV